MVALAGTASQAATLLYEFTFNDSANETSTVSSGSLGGYASFTAPRSSSDSSRVDAKLRSDNGLGVSGKLGDYAFNNTGSDKMGGSGAIDGANAGHGGIALVNNGSASLAGMNSYTISGWYNTANSTKPGNYARLIEVGTTGIWFQVDSGVTTLQVTSIINPVSGNTGGTSNKLNSNTSTLLSANEWVFFAVTFDGVAGTMTLYSGTKDEGVLHKVTSVETTKGFVATASNLGLSIGNSIGNANQRPFDGLLDNFRIWGEATGAGGALSLSELQAVMTADLGNAMIPEPATTALLLGMGLLAAVVMRRGQAK